MAIRNIFVTILNSKGGVCSLVKSPENVKALLNVLEYLQQNLKRIEQILPEHKRIYTEDKMVGIFDYGEDFEMNILNGLTEGLSDLNVDKKRIRIGIFARQLSYTLKYIVHSINCIDKICVRKMAEDYNEVLIQNLTQIAHLASKNRVANQALRSVMINDFVIQLFTSFIGAKTPDEVLDKAAEIALVSDILYNSKTIENILKSLVFLNDDGKLPLLWGDTLNKIIPPISKILKDEKNDELFGEARDLRVVIIGIVLRIVGFIPTS